MIFGNASRRHEIEGSAGKVITEFQSCQHIGLVFCGTTLSLKDASTTMLNIYLY